MTVRRWRVRGTVQGVGFRAFVFRSGRALEVRGGVRNEPDGSVTVVGSGAPHELARFAEELARGPRFARVVSIQAEDLAGPDADEPFDLEF